MQPTKFDLDRRSLFTGVDNSIDLDSSVWVRVVQDGFSQSDSRSQIRVSLFPANRHISVETRYHSSEKKNPIISGFYTLLPSQNLSSQCDSRPQLRVRLSLLTDTSQWRYHSSEKENPIISRFYTLTYPPKIPVHTAMRLAITATSKPFPSDRHIWTEIPLR
ncbi:hypothetical protein BaRGS_00000021 [Batillaria attramentaria]|uniref:Uncharacterized protein n=1 Tax=Batillaria attramentaria TaxID=370345 RepID=A0ABD0MAL5_9CAEN